MKRIILLVVIAIIAYINCSSNAIKPENKEIVLNGNIGYEIISKNNSNIEKIDIKLKDSLEKEPEFIYLLIGNILEGECNKFKINFKLGDSNVNKGVKLLKFEKQIISLDISKKKLKNINVIYFYYSDIERKYHDAVYYGETKSLLEKVRCD